MPMKFFRKFRLCKLARMETLFREGQRMKTTSKNKNDFKCNTGVTFDLRGNR